MISNPVPAVAHRAPSAAQHLDRAPLSSALTDFVQSRSLRCVGLGVFYAWAWVLGQNPLLYQNASPLAMSWVYWIITVAMGQFIWIPLLLDKVPGRSLVRQKVFLYGVPLSMSLGTIVIATTHGGSTASWIQICIGSVLAGVGIGAMPVMWGEIYGSLRTKRATVGVGVSAMVAMLVYSGIINTPIPALQVGLTTLLPIACALLLRSSSRMAMRPEPTVENRIQAKRSSLRLVVIPAGYGLVYGVVVGATNLLSTTQYANSGSVTAAGSAVGAALILAGAIIFRRNLDIAGFTYQMIVPLLGVGLAMLPFTGNPLVSTGLVLSGFLIFDFIMYAIFADISYRLGYPPVRVFALGRSVSHFGVLIGVVGGRLFAANTALSHSNLMMMSLVLLYVLIFALAFALNAPSAGGGLSLVRAQDRKRPASGAGMARDASVTSTATAASGDTAHAAGATTADTPVPLPAITSECHALAVSCGLTRREEEVLSLLADGRTLPYIEKALYISEGTTRYHVRNIYRKLNVHNRQALLDRIERCQLNHPDDSLGANYPGIGKPA